MSLTVEEVRAKIDELDKKRYAKQITILVYTKEKERLLSCINTGTRTTRHGLKPISSPPIPIVVAGDMVEMEEVSVFTIEDCSSHDEEDDIIESSDNSDEVAKQYGTKPEAYINFSKRHNSGRYHGWGLDFIVPENTQHVNK